MNEDAQFSDVSAALNPLAMLVLLAGAMILLASSRQNGLKALLAVTVLVPMGQQFNILGLHFMFFRVLIAVGIMRVLLRGEYRGFSPKKVDILMILWASIEVICGAVRGFQAQQLGYAYDALGVYFLVRFLTKEPEDVLVPLRFLCLLSLVVAGVMIFEASTHRNPFSVMGGVPLVDSIRDGRARAQGPFPHPIAAGAFGAGLFPLMVGLWSQGNDNRRAAKGGIIGCIIIVITSVSSGAILTTMAAVIGLGLWWWRDRMRLFRRAILVGLIALNVVMKVPVWWLIAKVSDLVGGSGWYRSWLIDICIHHVGAWWLVGDSFTHNWAPEVWATVGDPDNLDITNYYVVQCILGGIWMLAAFIAIITRCLQIVGGLVHSNEKLVWERFFIWTFGVSLAAYCTTFISMAVANQSSVFWHWLLAVAVGLPTFVVGSETNEESVGRAAADTLVKPGTDHQTEPFYAPDSL